MVISGLGLSKIGIQKKSDGTFRDDRTRLRYRLRAGASYSNKWYTTGFRIRTGDQNKQQDPQLTLGQGFEEFGTLPIGFEKAYFQGKWKTYVFWVGKNTFPFKKSNELFWSDNVYPEGIFLAKDFLFNSTLLNSLKISGGHFIMSSTGKSLGQDAYFQGLQAHAMLFDNRLEFFPSFYFFKNIPNIPDGFETFEIDYAILHLGAKFNLIKNQPLDVELDYYNNLEDYGQNDSIPNNLKDEKTSVVVGLKYGR